MGTADYLTISLTQYSDAFTVEIGGYTSVSPAYYGIDIYVTNVGWRGLTGWGSSSNPYISNTSGTVSYSSYPNNTVFMCRVRVDNTTAGYNWDGSWKDSNSISKPIVPTKPTNVNATVTGKTTCSITFTKGSNANSTYLTLSPSGGTFTNPTTGTSFSITGLTAGTDYSYTLKSYNDSSGYYSDGYSGTFKTQSAPILPANLTATTCLLWIDTVDSSYFDVSMTEPYTGNYTGTVYSYYDLETENGTSYWREANVSPSGWNSQANRAGDFVGKAKVTGVAYNTKPDLRARVRLANNSSGTGAVDNWVYSSWITNPWYKPTDMKPYTCTLQDVGGTSYKVTLTTPKVIGINSSTSVNYAGSVYYSIDVYDGKPGNDGWHGIQGWTQDAKTVTVSYSTLPTNIQKVKVRARACIQSDTLDWDGTSWTYSNEIVNPKYVYAPPVPTNVHATFSTTSQTEAIITFDWPTDTKVTAIQFYYTTTPDKPVSVSPSASTTNKSTTSYTFRNLTTGRPYWLWCCSQDLNGYQSEWVGTEMAVPHLEPSDVIMEIDYGNRIANASCTGSPTNGFWYWEKRINTGTWYGSDVYSNPKSQSLEALSIGDTVTFRVCFQSNYLSPVDQGYVRSTPIETSSYTRASRPSNFTWSTSFSSGTDMKGKIKATDWNKLTYKVNEFRDYIFLPSITFTKVEGVSTGVSEAQSTVITATIFNEVRDAIKEMVSATDVPHVDQGGSIYAKYFLGDSTNKGIVYYLNSIS